MGSKQSKKEGAPPERTLITLEEGERVAREAEEERMRKFKKGVVPLIFYLDDKIRELLANFGSERVLRVTKKLQDVQTDAPFPNVSDDVYARKLFDVLNEMLVERGSQWIIQTLKIEDYGTLFLEFIISFEAPPAYEKSVYKRQKMN